MRILITGVTGLIGRPLRARLEARGDQVVGLTRSAPSEDGGLRQWDPAGSSVSSAVVSGFDVVVHLAGENIGEGRWTTAKKARIRDSRVRSTQILSEALARREARPRLVVSGSAIGYYGNRGSAVLDEDSGPGSGFLSDVVVAWENAAAPLRDAGVPVVHPRTGPVLSTQGGALAKMLPPFKMGLGGVVGSGAQYMSWIALDDAVAALQHLIDHGDAMSGAINVVAPNPATNRDFTRTLGRVIKRPTALHVPALAARLAAGEMADELLLVSQRASSKRLEATGFEFRFPELAAALKHVIETNA